MGTNYSVLKPDYNNNIIYAAAEEEAVYLFINEKRSRQNHTSCLSVYCIKL
jgi:hypothetical protein